MSEAESRGCGATVELVWGRSAAEYWGLARTPKSTGYVYFIQTEDSEGCCGPIKIGWSGDVGARMASLQSAHPYKLHLLVTIRAQRSLERRLHRRFADHRLSGEWFEDCPEIQEFLSGV